MRLRNQRNGIRDDMKPMTLRELDAIMHRSPEYVQAVEKLGPYFVIASQILRMRVGSGWTQAELAKKAGLTRNTIVSIEAALSNPTVRTLDTIASAFDMTVQVLFVEKKNNE